MTTIATDGKVIAADSYGIRGSTIVSNKEEKIQIIGGMVFAGAGTYVDVLQAIDCFLQDKPAPHELKCDLLCINKGGQLIEIMVEKDKICTLAMHSELPAAIGSGAEFALAAMDHGKNPIEAVKYAASRDVYTGGPVQYLYFGSNKVLFKNS